MIKNFLKMGLLLCILFILKSQCNKNRTNVTLGFDSVHLQVIGWKRIWKQACGWLQKKNKKKFGQNDWRM